MERRGTERRSQREEGGGKEKKVKRTSRAGVAEEANRTAEDLRRDRLGAEDSERAARRNIGRKEREGGKLDVGRSSTSQRQNRDLSSRRGLLSLGLEDRDGNRKNLLFRTLFQEVKLSR